MPMFYIFKHQIVSQFDWTNILFNIATAMFCIHKKYSHVGFVFDNSNKMLKKGFLWLPFWNVLLYHFEIFSPFTVRYSTLFDDDIFLRYWVMNFIYQNIIQTNRDGNLQCGGKMGHTTFVSNNMPREACLLDSHQ